MPNWLLNNRQRPVFWLAAILILLALLAYIGYLAIYFNYAIKLFQFPFDYDQGEGYELLDTLMLSRGESPYRESNSYPFYASNYPPVYHLFIVPLVWIFGPQYWTGRLVAFLSSLITAGILGYAVYREQKVTRWWLVILSTLMYTASNYVYHIGPLFRQHIFMIMFEAAAVVLMAIIIQKEEGDDRPRSKWLILVMLLLLLAGFTKQLAYATVAALFIFWFLRDIKRSIIWAIGFAAVTGLVFFAINFSTDNQWWFNTISANLNEFFPDQAIGLYRQWFKLHRMITLAAAVYVLYELYFERLSIYSVWFVLTAVNSVTAGTWGAGESYFVTTVSASIILSGIAFSRLLDYFEIQAPDWSKNWAMQPYVVLLIAIPLLYLWQANSVFHMPTGSAFTQSLARMTGRPDVTWVAPQTSCSEDLPAEPLPYVDDAFVLIGRPPTTEDTIAGQQIAAEILQGSTPAFSEEAGFNFYVGREIVTNPTQLRNLYLAGLLDVTEMVTMLQNQEFDTVIFRAQFYPPEVLQAVGQYYEQTNLIQMNGFVYCIYQPN
ncbi:MAG: glycosyltransferase family 39 protein [Chloroflexota bacterium]